MWDESSPTAASNRTTTYNDLQHFYVTFYDEANNQYINDTHNITEVGIKINELIMYLQEFGITQLTIYPHFLP